jgi:dTMP kinase
MLIDIEGIDGSGKGTQAKRLCERLTERGVTNRLISFPRYSETLFGQIAGEFLNGRFGSLEQVDPLLAALIFAGDRAESRDFLRTAMQECEIVVLDRYVPSNIAHQAAKRTGRERDELIARIERIEHDIHQLPRPDLTLLLDLPVATAQTLIARKAARDYTDKKADLQEADAGYLAAVRDVYAHLATSRPGWQVIDCLTAGQLRSVEEIGEDVFAAVGV